MPAENKRQYICFIYNCILEECVNFPINQTDFPFQLPALRHIFSICQNDVKAIVRPKTLRSLILVQPTGKFYRLINRTGQVVIFGQISNFQVKSVVLKKQVNTFHIFDGRHYVRMLADVVLDKDG